jgi:tetratricopeptide (TPR) repeat protein
MDTIQGGRKPNTQNNGDRESDITDAGLVEIGRLEAELVARRLPEALAIANQLLRAHPRDSRVLAVCGQVFFQVGQWAVARDAFRGALALGGDNAKWHDAAGRASLLMRDWVGAEAHLRRALATSRDDADLQIHLAIALLEMDRPRQAQSLLMRVARIAPERVDVYRLLARVARVMGRPEEALARFRAAIARAPEHGPDYMQCGDILQELGRLGDAIKAYQAACEALPNNAEAWIQLGGCFHMIGVVPEAERCYKEALRANPGHPEAYVALGNTYGDTGRVKEAWEVLRKAQTAYPDYLPARIAEANLFERIGQDREAAGRLKVLREEFPESPPLLLLAARLAKTAVGREAALVDLEACLGYVHRRRSKDLESLIRFTMAHLHDQLGNPAEAFEHFNAGNAWRRLVKPYMRDSVVEEFGLLQDTFSQEPALQNAAFQTIQRRPIFLVGMPRSGTSLAEQILASHPDVFGAGELNTLNRLFVEKWQPPRQGDREGTQRLLDVDHLKALSDSYWEALPEAARQSARVTDKMPHNFRYVGLIRALFPEAKIIHCRRDPLDTCLSCFMQNFAEGNAYSHDLADCGFFYRQYVTLMDHWRSVLREPFFELQYETLVADPEPTVRALLDYCGLPWDDACLRFHENPRVVHTASYKQVREPLYTRSVGRWRHYAAYLTPLVEELGDLVPETDRAFIRAATEKAGKAGDGATQAAVG